MAETVRGNMAEEDKIKVVATLTNFSEILCDICMKKGIGPGQAPFVRLSNFLVVLDPNALHIIVDDIPIGGIPDHIYLDRRTERPVLPLDALIGVAVRELGFRQPIGLTLPIQVLYEDITERNRILTSIAIKVSEEILTRIKSQQLNLPHGFEHFSRYFPAFLSDHPSIEHNVFLMMRFKDGFQYKEIEKTIRQCMAKYGLNVLRADDKDYTGDLWENVCLYMLGSKYGIAVFEEIDEREFNPSVALELGFMLAHDKRCLILKDQRMPKMPTDIVGKLYKQFDTYNISASISFCIDSWVRDIGL